MPPFCLQAENRQNLEHRAKIKSSLKRNICFNISNKLEIMKKFVCANFNISDSNIH